MFNVGAGEMVVIAVFALLVLGPKRLPELARGLGKFLREFRRQTDEVRNVVEREFYRMDQDEAPPQIQPAQSSVPAAAPASPSETAAEPAATEPTQLPLLSTDSSQITAGLGASTAEPEPQGANDAPAPTSAEQPPPKEKLN